MCAGPLHILPGDGCYVVCGCIVNVWFVFGKEGLYECLVVVVVAIVDWLPCVPDDLVNLQWVSCVGACFVLWCVCRSLEHL